MGFLKKIFKKKKGGTLVGNLIRGVANKVSGGKLGTGKHMLKDDKNKDPDPSLIKVGSAVGDYANQMLTPVISQAITGSKETTSSNLLSAVTDPLADATMDSFWTSIKKRWYIIALPFGLIVFIIWYVSKGKKRTYRR